ncbi:hypothetical protein WAB17_06455 [Parerythrobacter aurantius]|uniref:lipopolysaccharide biosynthesis protein n=1 Tax=Parerythrobacter aurantius TaxID=3127706 RepID=UPI00325667AA
MLMPLRNRLAYLRIRPFKGDTEEVRTAERYRRALWTLIASVLARAIGLVTMILSINLTVPYLGEERFGAWMTISSLAAMLSFLDLGIGNALTNRVALAATDPEDAKLKAAISGGLGVLFMVSLLVGLGMTVAADVVDWRALLKLQSEALVAEVGLAATVFAFLFAAMTFANGVGRTFHGMQRGFEVHIATAIGSLASLVAVYVFAQRQAGIPVLLVCMLAGPILAQLALLVRLRFEKLFDIPQTARFARSEAGVLLRGGSLFFLLQIGTMVGWGADSLIIANAVGTGAVAAFAVIQRLTFLVAQPLAMINAPLWSAYADASFRKEHRFIRKTLKRSFGVSLLVSAAGAIMIILFGKDIIDYWTSGEVTPAQSLIAVMAVWMILECTGNAFGIFLNGIGVVIQQVWVVALFVICALPLKLWLAATSGAFGVVLAGIIAYLAVTCLGYGLVFRRDIEEKVA